MRQLVPSCWTDFHCIAGACRHSCCIGWEIDIDEDTLEAYRARTDALGDRLRENIEDGEAPHFRLTAKERCPFLNADNLCDIILTAGEDALCDICTNHPRYYNCYPDCVEMGYGLCCEEAVRLLLEWEEALTCKEEHLEEADDEPSEEYLFLRKQRDALICALQDRSRPLMQRADWNHNLSFDAFRDLLSGLEYIEEDWHAMLPRLHEPEIPPEDTAEHIWEKLLVCIVWRYYLPFGLQRWQEDFALEFGILSVRLLQAMFDYCRQTRGTLTQRERIDLIRMWSSELEYSEENLDAIAEWLSEQQSET